VIFTGRQNGQSVSAQDKTNFENKEPMATNISKLTIDASPEKVWDALPL
jgi:hypothetical protein